MLIDALLLAVHAVMGALYVAGASDAFPDILRRQIIPLLGLFFAAFVCAGVVDFLHVKAAPQSVLSRILGMLEDGGEMVFLSLMVSYTAGLLDKAAPKVFVADPA